MRSKHGFAIVMALLMLLLTISAATAFASDGATGKHVTKKAYKFMRGDEETNAASAVGTGATRLYPRAGVVGSPGITWYDYQHNGTMGRQVAYDGVGDYVHFIWMWSDYVEPTGNDRHAVYNAFDLNSPGFMWADVDENGGKQISGYQRAGYCTIDVTSAGAAVVSFHEAVGLDFTSRADWDTWTPLGYFDHLDDFAPGPPNCQGWFTGTEEEGAYSWPVVDWDLVGEETVIHVVSCEGPNTDDAGEIQTLVYYRKVNDEWPECANAVDSVYTVSPTVRSDPNSDKVAIVYLKPMYYDDDPMDPCGWTQWQNDVVYYESTNGGLSFLDHTAWFTNVTDYSQGHTLASDEIMHMAYTDVSALYDSYGHLHIVWNTPLRDLHGDDPCIPLYASRVWHWDDFNQCTSLVYDATRPRFHCRTGAFMISTGKMNISECAVDDTTRLYVSFSRMGAHTSADGDTNADCSDEADFGNFANGDIYVTGSSDGGLTWGPNPAHPLYSDVGPNSGPVQNGTAVNLTNTLTDECLPGDCMSEHWGTMSKYNIDSLHLMYVEDHDAGAGIRGTDAGDEEGLQTENLMQYAREGCFWPGYVCGISAIPVDIAVTISPTTGYDCTVPQTATFDITLTNTGNQPINFTAAANQTFISPLNTGGAIGVGCDNTATINYTAGPIAAEGQYEATITVTANCGGDDIVLVIDVAVNVDCYPAEYATLSTTCWSVDVWNTARVGGGDDEGQMYWFLYPPVDGFPLMYDESIIITFADDTCESYFSMFDGSDSNANIVSTSALTTETVWGTYEHAYAEWATGDYQYDPANDPAIVGEIDYYLPVHPDTCVLIERIEICNNVDTTVRIHIGEAIDWDIPDGEGGWENHCGKDEARQMVYQYGPLGTPEEEYYGGAAFCNDIAGAVVLANLDWIYDQSGYQVCQIGGLLARHTGFEAECDDSMQDMNSVYVIAHDVVLEPDSCVVYCMVKTSTLAGLTQLQGLIDRGKEWIIDHGLDCPGSEPWPPCVPGDADASGDVHLDDVVVILTALCNPPQPLEICADANGDCSIDVYDIRYLIDYIYTGGPAPVNPGCSNPPVKPDPGDPDSVIVMSGVVTVATGEPFSVPIYVFNDEGLWQIKFDEFFVEYTRGSGVLSCDSVTYWGTRLETSPPLPIRSLSTSGFESADGGYIYLSMESSSSGDTLFHGAGDVVNVWFTGQAAGLAEITYPSPAEVLYISTAGYKKRQDYNCFEPILDFGTVEVIGVDPVLVATPTGSHSFEILVGENPGHRLEHDFTVTIINDAGLTLCEPLAPPNYPELEVVTAPEEEGRYVCHLPAGGVAPACSAVVELSNVPLATVPVRVVDVDGDLYVSPDDFDWGYSDLDGDGDVDNDDFYIFNQYLWQSCSENPCAANTQAMWFTPPEEIEAGDTIDVCMSYKNNLTDPVFLEGVRLFATPYGYGMDEYEYLFINLGSWVAPGVEYVVEVQSFVIPDSGIGCLAFTGTVSECPGDSFRVETCPNVFVECDPGEVACYAFKTYLTDDAYVFPYPPSEPYGWGFQIEPEQGYYPSGDSIVLVLCHTAATSAVDSIVYTCFLCEHNILDEDCERREYRAVISATNGDASCDCEVDIDDVVYLISYIFSGGPEPCIYELGDPDCSYGVDIDDVVYLINYIFSGGDPPELCI